MQELLYMDPEMAAEWAGLQSNADLVKVIHATKVENVRRFEDAAAKELAKRVSRFINQ